MREGRHWVRRCLNGCRDNGPYYQPPDRSPCAWCGGKVRIVVCAGGRPIHTSHPTMMSQKGFTPHYNEGMGRRAESNHDFQQWLDKNGCEIADPHDAQNIPSNFK